MGVLDAIGLPEPPVDERPLPVALAFPPGHRPGSEDVPLAAWEAEAAR